MVKIIKNCNKWQNGQEWKEEFLFNIVKHGYNSLGLSRAARKPHFISQDLVKNTSLEGGLPVPG